MNQQVLKSYKQSAGAMSSVYTELSIPEVVELLDPRTASYQISNFDYLVYVVVVACMYVVRSYLFSKGNVV